MHGRNSTSRSAPSRSPHSRFGNSGSSFARTRNGSSSRGKGRGGYSQRIDISKFINKAVITTKETVKFVPTHSFADFPIDERLKKNIIKKGYVTPTPIQDTAIPHALKGKDIVGIANTGTGKTAAFLIPLIDKVLKNDTESTLIVVPTRELATQIEDELCGFIAGLKLYGVTCVGGTSMSKQIRDLKYQNHFVIGTPGRLKDLIERKSLDLSKFHTIVLDEADRMLDMGFIADMKFMMAKMPTERQVLFFSATMSPEIKTLVAQFLREPVSVSVKTGDTSKNVDQDIIRIERGANKMDVLHDLLNSQDFSKVLVFGRTKHGVEQLSNDLVKRGFKSESIHGNKNQSKRQRALDQFKKNQLQVLVATDVAARGIDVSDISHVINYDLPDTYENYVHCIGRTGRAGKLGKALTFVE